MQTGWIKSWRKKLNSSVWQMPPVYGRVWEYLLHTVDHKTGTLKTSLNNIATGVSWIERGIERKPNRKTISVVLGWMEQENMISIESNKLFTCISITNWMSYNHPESMKVTVEGQVNGLPSGLPSGHITRSTTEVQEKNNLPNNTVVVPASSPQPDIDAGVVVSSFKPLIKPTRPPLDSDIYILCVRRLSAIFCRTDSPTGPDVEIYQGIIQTKGPAWVIEKANDKKDIVIARTANRSPWAFFRGVLQNAVKDPNDGKSLADIIADMEMQKFLNAPESAVEKRRRERKEREAQNGQRRIQGGDGIPARPILETYPKAGDNPGVA